MGNLNAQDFSAIQSRLEDMRAVLVSLLDFLETKKDSEIVIIVPRPRPIPLLAGPCDPISGGGISVSQYIEGLNKLKNWLDDMIGFFSGGV